MINKLVVYGVLILVLFLNACSGVFVKEKKDFIKVKGSMFELAGNPYYFLGTNMWYGCYIGSKGNTGDRDRLLRELDFLKSLNVTNLRILAGSEESEINNSVKPGIQYKAGEYDEELLDGLDFLLAEMGKRGMHGVLYFTNYWEWSGGMSQYNAWINGKLIDPAKPGSGNNWQDFMQYSASFYTNEKANELFRKYAAYLINRKNNYTGILYKNDPVIMAWQLANEPRPGNINIPEIIQSYLKWVDETAAYIHSLDTNHLVTTGNEGLAGSLFSEDIYLEAHKSKNIDYMTFHLWPKNWGWFDARRVDETYSRTVENAVDYIKKHINYARIINKPLTLEEFGLSRDMEFIKEGTPVTARDNYFTTIFKLIYDSAAVNSPIAGSNFWAWGGEGRAASEDGKWRKGDPFTGDPLQEPQGFNSVINTDSSTIKIISFFAARMKEIGAGDRCRNK